MQTLMKVSIAPLPACWSRDAVTNFYDAVALSSVDIVYIGNVLCSSRPVVQRRERLAIARELASSGKEVVLSVRRSSEEVAADSATKWIRESGFRIEAGDANSLALLAGNASFVAGPEIPCDGASTLRRLVEWGATRWVMNAVCAGDAMQALKHARGAACEIELPVLHRRQVSDSQCPIVNCVHGGESICRLMGCDHAGRAQLGPPDWPSGIDRLRVGRVSILRVVPRTPREINLAQMLSELVRVEIGAGRQLPVGGRATGGVMRSALSWSRKK